MYELFDKSLRILWSRESVDLQLKKDSCKYMTKNIILTIKKFFVNLLYTYLDIDLTITLLSDRFGTVKNILSIRWEKKYSFHKSREEICFHFNEPIHEISKLGIGVTVCESYGWRTGFKKCHRKMTSQRKIRYKDI